MPTNVSNVVLGIEMHIEKEERVKGCRREGTIPGFLAPVEATTPLGSPIVGQVPYVCNSSLSIVVRVWHGIVARSIVRRRSWIGFAKGITTRHTIGKVLRLVGFKESNHALHKVRKRIWFVDVVVMELKTIVVVSLVHVIFNFVVHLVVNGFCKCREKSIFQDNKFLCLQIPADLPQCFRISVLIVEIVLDAISQVEFKRRLGTVAGDIVA
mmetsp:Transcript_50128/g.74843  ORF Transcript_50128/g.74843 Transcript_50128/m.74843 type:complete len:211 (-) Transcript_50128:182-814(-)